ncbi:MAG: PQQ-binding-like beta-propeller repeat protein [Nitrospirota bacterium]
MNEAIKIKDLFGRSGCDMNEIRYKKGIIFLLTLSAILSGFFCEKAYSGSTWLLVDSPRPSSQAGIFETDLKFTTWDAAIGAYTVAVHYDPSVVEILQIIVPPDSEFFGNTFGDESSFKSGTTNISAFQVTNFSDKTSPSAFATIQWRVINSASSLPSIALEAKNIIDYFWRPIEVNISGITDSSALINLVSPIDKREFTACSYYNPPIFQWATTENFKNIEVQFSKEDNFASIPVKSKVKSGVNQLSAKPSLWKKILLLPGGNGGRVYWRVVGTKADKTRVYSGILSLEVNGPEPVGEPIISSTDITSLPVLSWQNNCNRKFNAWFGNDCNFTKKKSLTFTIKNPNDNGGAFIKALTSAQWTSIRKLVGDIGGSTIYWHVESWDILKRYSKTEIKDFVIESTLVSGSLNVTTQDLVAPKIAIVQIWPMFGHDAQHTGRSFYVGPSTTPISKWTSHLFDVYNTQIILDSNDALIYGIGHSLNKEQNRLLSLNTKTNLFDEFIADSNIYATPAIDSNGTIYLADGIGNIYALDPDFSLKWKKSGYFGDQNYLHAPPTIAPDGNIYMVGNDTLVNNSIICVTQEGLLKWRYKPSDTPVASLSPAVGTDGTVFACVKDDDSNSKGGIVALNPDGTFKWEYTVEDTPTLSPVIGPDDTIYVGTRQFLYAIHPDGSLKWIKAATEYELNASAIGPDGTIYANFGGSLSAVRPEDGSIIWTFNFIDNSSYMSNENTIAIASDGTVYIGTQDYLYAINPDGSVKWKYYSPNTFFMSPIIGQDGTIYVHHEGSVSALSE